MRSRLPVLRFEPIVKPLPWGGRRLDRLLGKKLPPDLPCGESWEVVDLPGAQSVVAGGRYRGMSLENLLAERRPAILGEASLLLGRFPLLFKFIDAAQTLSVQVHPDEEACARIGQGARPKTEAWYVLDAAPGSRLYLGLRSGVTAEDLQSALVQGTVESLLETVTVQPGDFIYLPAGLLHAIGGGILLAEIQQSSDTTYRVFDWNRPGLDGRPRQLHVQQALQAIRFDWRGKPETRPPVSGRPGLIGPGFSFELLQLQPGQQVGLTDGLAQILACIEGSLVFDVVGQPPVEVSRGETCLVPAETAGRAGSPDGGKALLIQVLGA